MLGGLACHVALPPNKARERECSLGLGLAHHWKRERRGRACITPCGGAPFVDFTPLGRGGLSPESYAQGPCGLYLHMHACLHAFLFACSIGQGCMNACPHVLAYPCTRRLIPQQLCSVHFASWVRALSHASSNLSLETHFIHLLGQTLLKRVLFKQIKALIKSN